MRAFLLGGVAALVLAACSQQTEVPATTPAPASTEATATGPAIALYALDCGHAHTADAGMFADDGAYDHQAKDLVDPCYLIRHPEGDLLWDTGFPQAIADQPNGIVQMGMTITVPHKLTDQLTQLQLTPADIDFVSLSHSHGDHVGNLTLFPTATWIVDADERTYMFRPQARADAQSFAAYSAAEAWTPRLIEGNADFDVFGDGSVKIIQAPGHTPGHTVLLVNLRSGPVLLSGDMWHVAESRAARRVPRFNTDRAQTLASMDKVEALAAQTHARVIRHHVPEDFAGLPAFPEPLR